MLEITTILSLALGIVLIPILGWYSARDSKPADTFRVIDIALISFVVFLVLSRALGLFFYSEGLPNSWSLLPITQPENEVLYLETWPWVIFRVIDGRFLFVEFIAALFLVELIFRNLFESRLGLKNLIKSQHVAAGVYMVALIPLFISAYFNGYLVEETDLPVTVLLATLAALNSLLLILFSKNAVLSKILFLLNQITAVAAFNFLYIGERSLIGVNIILISLIIANALYTLSEVSSFIRASRQAAKTRPNRVRMQR
jgi:hypothetical protein